MLVILNKRTLSYTDIELFLMVYNSLIRSVFRLWLSSVESKYKEIQKVNRKCPKTSDKLVPESKMFSYQERLRELNLPT